MSIAIARDPIYRRRAPMLAIKSFATPADTLAGIELAHHITRLNPRHDDDHPSQGCVIRMHRVVCLDLATFFLVWYGLRTLPTIPIVAGRF